MFLRDSDIGNVDNKLILLVWFDASGSDEMIHTYTRYVVCMLKACVVEIDEIDEENVVGI